MAKQQVTEKLAGEIQSLRKVMPHAENVGAVQTNISIELLAVLLASYDEANPVPGEHS